MLVAFSGKFCSGKSTASAKIVEKIEKAVVLSFAEPIYNLAYEYWGMKEKDRDLLIFIGQTWKQRDPKIWINILLRKAKELQEQGFVVIIDDLRFEDEFNALKKAGAVLVRLNLSKKEQIHRVMRTYPETWREMLKKSNDVTETALDEQEGWDWFTTIDPTEEEVELMIEEMFNMRK